MVQKPKWPVELPEPGDAFMVVDAEGLLLWTPAERVAPPEGERWEVASPLLLENPRDVMLSRGEVMVILERGPAPYTFHCHTTRGTLVLTVVDILSGAVVLLSGRREREGET